MKFIKLAALALASFFYASAALAQNAGTVTANAFAIGKGPGTTGYASLLCGSAQLAVGQSAAAPLCKTISGDVTLSAAGAVTLATVNSNVGSFGSATQAPVLTVNAKGLITAVSTATVTPAIGSVTRVSVQAARRSLLPLPAPTYAVVLLMKLVRGWHTSSVVRWAHPHRRP